MSSQQSSSPGYNFVFSVFSNADTSYTVPQNAVLATGKFFRINDSIVILGTFLGGTTPTNDLTIRVTGITKYGAVTSYDVVGDSFGPTQNTLYGPFNFVSPGTQGYRTTLIDVRDASDWITMKKQLLRAADTAGPKGESFSNSSRIDVKQGILKQNIFGCTGCFGGAFNGN